MLVRAKRYVQKSFRIDSDVERDLSVLSRVTGRSQNDLVNVSLCELLQDNKTHLLDIVILEHFNNQLCQLDEKTEIDPFEMGGLTVCFEFTQKGIKVSYKCDCPEVIEEFEDYTSQDFENYLIDISRLIDIRSADVKDYLNDRTDYRDYIKIKEK